MKIEEAIKMCASDKNFIILWTYGDGNRFFSTRKMAESDRDYRNVPEYAPNKKKAAEYWPVYRCLVAEKYGFERDVMYDKIEEE